MPRNNGPAGAVIVPATVAIVEFVKADGRSLIAAIATGLEVAIAVLNAVGRMFSFRVPRMRCCCCCGSRGQPLKAKNCFRSLFKWQSRCRRAPSLVRSRRRFDRKEYRRSVPSRGAA